MAKEISSELLNTILTRVGGPGNIASCGNCMTRLRLGVHDSSLVDPDIKTLEGVKGVILTSDQVQVVFGPGKAHRAAKAMSELLGEAPVQDAAEIAAQNKRQLKAKQTSGVQQFLAKFATIFTPLIPGFIAAGLLLGIATTNRHGDTRSGRCSGNAARRAEFYEGVQQRLVHLPGNSGWL